MEQDWDALGYYYNLSDLKKVGLSHVPSRLTWNPTNGGGLLKLAEKLTVASNGTHPGQAGFNPDDIVQYGFVWTNSSVGPYDMSPWLHSNGGTIVTSTGKLEINSPQNIQTVQFIKNLIYKYHVSPQIEPMISATPYALFVGGRAAIWQSGPWELATLKAQAPFPFGISMTAAGPDGSWTRSNTLVNAIYAKTKHEHDAWLFVKFIEGPKAQAILAGAGDEVPASPAGYNKWKAHWAKEGINVEPFIKATHDNGGRVATDPDVPNFPEFSDVWYADMEKILSNKIGVAAGMNLLQKQEEAVIHGKSAT
jgi:multiple sugar transport system substrate-binding protein